MKNIFLLVYIHELNKLAYEKYVCINYYKPKSNYNLIMNICMRFRQRNKYKIEINKYTYGDRELDGRKGTKL